MFQLSLAFSKSSILLLYLRVLRYQIVYWATCTLFAVVILINTIAFAINMTQCIFLVVFWVLFVKGDCHPRAYPMAIICIHIITDFLMFCLPLPVVLGMQLKLSQKIVLVLVFTLGFMYVSGVAVAHCSVASPFPESVWGPLSPGQTLTLSHLFLYALHRKAHHLDQDPEIGRLHLGSGGRGGRGRGRGGH